MENNLLEVRNENNKKLNFVITALSCFLVLLIDLFFTKGSNFIMAMFSLLIILSTSYYVTFKSKNEDIKIVIVPLLFIFGTFLIAFIQKGIPQAITCIVVSFLMCSSYFRYDLLKLFFTISNIVIILFTLSFQYLLGYSFAKSISFFDDIMKIIGLFLIQCMLLGILKFTNQLVSKIENQKIQVENNLLQKQELTKLTEDKFKIVTKQINEISSESDNINQSFKEFEIGIDSQVSNITDINTSITSTITVINKLKDISTYIKDVAFVNLLEITNQNICKLENSNNKVEEVNVSLKNTSDLVKSFDKNINKIIEVLSSIQSISDSVNLLSFNASIEAARAGESGRGFSVVAQEIKKLSTETKQTTFVINNYIKEIQEDLNKITNEIDENNFAIKETKETMNSVVSDFSTMKEVFNLVENNLSNSELEVQKTSNYMNTIQLSIENCIAITQEYVATIEDVSSRQNNQNNLLKDVEKNMFEVENYIKSI